MTEINSFNRNTSLGLIDLLRLQRRNTPFEHEKARSSDLNDYALFFKTPPEGIPARTPGVPPRPDGVCGKAECIRYRLLDNGEFEETEGKATVWNSEDGEDIPGDIIIRVHLLADKLVADTTDGIIKFRAKTAIAGRRFEVTGIQGRYGTFDMFDPHNMWTTVTPGCIGTAYRGLGGELEIHTCSLPANEIMVILQETLKSTTSVSEAVVADEFYLRSTYPNVMKPPEIGACSGFCTYTWNRSLETWNLTSSCSSGCACAPAPTGKPKNQNDEYRYYPCEATGEQTIEFTNPWKLDGMCSSKAILRRVTDADWGDSRGITDWTDTPINGSATQVRWEIVQVAKRKARWIKFTYSSEEPPEIDDYWDGDHPQECDDTADCTECQDEITIEYPLGAPCDGDTIVARYNPERDSYMAQDTRASMLGTPVERNFVNNITNHDCGLTMYRTNVQVFMIKDGEGSCTAASTPTNVTLGTTIPIMMEANSDQCGQITYLQQFARVFLCDGEIVQNAFAINFDGVEFVIAAAFGPPTCSGEATYRIGLNVGLSNWELVTPCEDGCESVPPPLPDPIPTPETFETVPCSSAADRQCGLNLQMGTICASNSSGSPLPNIVHVPLPLEPVEVVTRVYDNYVDAIVTDSKIIYVCNWETAPSNQIPVGPCGSSSGGGGPTCTGYATYGWNVATQNWYVVLNCANGCQPTTLPTDPPEDPSEYSEIQVSCIEGEL